MTYVKCGFCSNKIKKENAYVLKGKKRNKYFCNEEHSVSKTPKGLFYGRLFSVFGKTTNTIMYKEFDEISKVHGWDKMSSYLEANRSYLNKCMNKDFTSEYAKIRYISAIFKNSLGDFREPKKDVVVKKSVVQDCVFVPVKRKEKKEENLGMDALLDELLG